MPDHHHDCALQVGIVYLATFVLIARQRTCLRFKIAKYLVELLSQVGIARTVRVTVTCNSFRRCV